MAAPYGVTGGRHWLRPRPGTHARAVSGSEGVGADGIAPPPHHFLVAGLAVLRASQQHVGNLCYGSTASDGRVLSRATPPVLACITTPLTLVVTIVRVNRSALLPMPLVSEVGRSSCRSSTPSSALVSGLHRRAKSPRHRWTTVGGAHPPTM